MPDPFYVVAGAVRIQQWIARTPLLKLSRGASAALAARTSPTCVNALLSGAGLSAQPAEGAPNVDGVIALQVADAGQVKDAVDWLRRTVAVQLPGVEWSVWCHQAPTYVQAFAAEGRQEVLTDHRWLLPSADLSLPWARSCEGCHQEVALAARTYDEDGEPRQIVLGPDCLVRWKYTDDLRKSQPGRAWTFDQLAGHGGVNASLARPQTLGRRGAANHLATVAADGNRVGALFTRLSSIPAVPFDDGDGRRATLHERISTQLHHAAAQAVEEAEKQSGQPDPQYAVAIRHLVGGDDVLVSVAARFAWDYVTELLTTFDREFATIDGVLQQARAATAADGSRVLTEADARELSILVGRVSLGVGIAFANRTHPFAHTTEMAQAALDGAKRAGKGAAAVSWVDLTVESAVPRGRFALAADLANRPPVFDLGPSARATLTGLIRDGRAQRQARLADPALADGAAAEIGAEVASWAQRTGRTSQLPDSITSVEDLERLESALDRARWAPQSSETEEAS